MAKQDRTHLATLYCTDNQSSHRITLKIWLSSDGILCTTFPDGTMEAGTPSLQVKRSSYLSYTYNPSETVYTGVTVGNVHTGGFHRTEASYSERETSSGRGFIQVSTRCDRFLLNSVSVPQEIQNRFRRDSEFQVLAPHGDIACLNSTNTEGSRIRSMLTGREDAATTIQTLSIAHDHRHLDYDHCLRIVRLLKRICKADFPPTADVLYARAEKLEKADDSRSLEQAMEDFRSLGHYKDAPARVAALKYRLAEAREREELQADRNRDRGKRVLILGVVLGIILMVLVALFL